MFRRATETKRKYRRKSWLIVFAIVVIAINQNIDIGSSTLRDLVDSLREHFPIFDE